MEMAVAKRDLSETDRRRTLSVVVSEAGPSKAEWVGWRTVARMISRGRRWIYRRAREGAWDARWDGSRWLFRRSAVEAWVEAFGRPT